MTKATPVLFYPKLIRKMIKKDEPGVYVLGNEQNGEFVPRYVGRSDYSLRKRLLTHNHLYEYDYVVFRTVSCSKEAFYTESKWWHDCNNNGYEIDNKIHPDAPSGTYIECPYCSFAKEMNNLLKRRKAS